MLYKSLILGTISLIITMLIAGIYYPESPVMWLADASSGYAFIRIAMIAILVTVLIYKAPRSTPFRIMIALLGASLITLQTVLLARYQISLFDSIVFAQVGILLLIESLEITQPIAKRMGMFKTQRAS